MTPLSPEEQHTLQQYILNTAADPLRGACGAAEFDSLELAWCVSTLVTPNAEAKESTPFTPDMVHPDLFAKTYTTPNEVAENEKYAAMQMLKGDDLRLAHKMAQFFVWQRYLNSFLNLNHETPCPPVLEPSDPSIALLRTRLMTELKQPSHGDGMITIARQLIRGCFGTVACENQFRRRFPAKRNGMALSDVLEADLESPQAKVDLNRQVALHPSRDGEWDQMCPRVRENWLLTMFVHRFNQDMPMTNHPLSFRDSYLLHWIDIGSPAGDSKLKRRTQLGHQRARPLVVHLGDEAWCLYDRQTKETLCRTSDVVRVLAAWLSLVFSRYEGRLENGVDTPRFDLYFASNEAPPVATAMDTTTTTTETPSDPV